MNEPSGGRGHPIRHEPTVKNPLFTILEGSLKVKNHIEFKIIFWGCVSPRRRMTLHGFLPLALPKT
jgi:hypothetical protein